MFESGGGGVHFGGEAIVGFVTYPQTLLRLAEQLFTQGESSVAVVVAHMGAEIAADRSLSEAFEKRGISDLEDSMTAFISGSVLTNERARKLFSALTGTDIASESFWQSYSESAKLRNKIAHKGVVATPEQARIAIDASSAVVKYLGRWGQPA